MSFKYYYYYYHPYHHQLRCHFADILFTVCELATINEKNRVLSNFAFTENCVEFEYAV